MAPFQLQSWLVLLVIVILIDPNLAEDAGKIVGGAQSTIAKFPWSASIRFNNTHFCGGTIYKPDWIITVAHCIEDFKGSTKLLTVVVGQTTLNGTDGIVANVSQLIWHPAHPCGGMDYDIGLLRLRKPLDFANVNIGAAQLSIKTPEKGTLVTVSGWGAMTSGSTNASNVLQAVEVPVIGRLQCRLEYIWYQVSENMFCAGYTRGGKDACQGDSGGPATVGDVLVGIVSWGRGCGSAFAPGVYADVATLRGFITYNAGIQ